MKSMPRKEKYAIVITLFPFILLIFSLIVFKKYLDMKLLIPLLITAFVTIYGWYVANRLNYDRDIKNKRIDMQISYLLKTWQALERISLRSKLEISDKKEIEDSIAIIQLLGTPRQAELIRSHAEKLSNDGKTNMLDLLMDMRYELRKMLEFEQINEKIVSFRAD